MGLLHDGVAALNHICKLKIEIMFTIIDVNGCIVYNSKY